ncbi:MOP flippase family protein [Orbaceae bacterium ESL0721]|nr:MOP flippase family protein [Orbaceae bacterium ESL0721]
MNNIKWVSLSQLSKIVSQVISMVVLSRLIAPDQFGVMAIAMVVVTFSSLFRDLGTSSAVIQRDKLSQPLLSAILGLNLIAASVIMLLIISFSPLIAAFFSQSELISVLSILALSFPIMSFGSIQLALFERESQFKVVGLIEISASLISLILSIIAASLHWGVYSLVVLNMASSLISTTLLWLMSSWRPALNHLFSLQEIKKIFSFSSHLTLFNFINYFARNADSMIIGKVFGAAILGAYSLAYRIMLFPLQSMTFIISRSLFPIMSRNQDNNDELRVVYLKVVSFIFFIVCPLMTGLAILRDPFVYVLFGTNWHLTSDILLWLAPTAIIQAVVSSIGPVLMAKGKTKKLFYLGVLGMILQVGAFLIGSQYDVVLLAKLYFIANIINAILPIWLVMKLLAYPVKNFLFLFVKPLLCNLSMFICLKIALTTPFFSSITYYWFGLLVLITIGIFTYALSALFLCKQEIRTIMRLVIK